MLYAQIKSAMKRLPSNSGRLVLALSGGVDSIVLLNLVKKFVSEHEGYSCKAVHVHHGLSANGDYWAQQCAKWAKDAGIEFTQENVSLEFAGKSVEQEAREARYRALYSHLNTGDVLLTAHHQDDQIETFLLAAKRGSGPAGLSSMPRVANIDDCFHLRPLLTASRSDIVAFAREQDLEWVEDESNQDTRYDRNFLRHDIIPQMAERWPGVKKAFSRSAVLCAEQEELINELLSRKLKSAQNPDGGLDMKYLNMYSERIGRQLIRMWLKGKGIVMPSQAQLNEIWDAFVVNYRADSNPEVCWGEVRIRRHKLTMYALRKWDDISDVVIPVVLNELKTKPCSCSLPQDVGILHFTLGEGGVLRQPRQDEPVTIRFNPSGIIVKPLGRVGRRKLKKLLQEYNVPSSDRRRTPLIYYGDKLAAVAGLFVAEEFAGNECDLMWRHNGKYVLIEHQDINGG